MKIQKWLFAQRLVSQNTKLLKSEADADKSMIVFKADFERISIQEPTASMSQDRNTDIQSQTSSFIQLRPTSFSSSMSELVNYLSSRHLGQSKARKIVTRKL